MATATKKAPAEKATGVKADSPEQYPIVAEALREKLDLDAAVITLDKNGSYLATRGRLETPSCRTLQPCVQSVLERLVLLIRSFAGPLHRCFSTLSRVLTSFCSVIGWATHLSTRTGRALMMRSVRSTRCSNGAGSPIASPAVARLSGTVTRERTGRLFALRSTR